MANEELDSSEKTMKVACGKQTPVLEMGIPEECLCLMGSPAGKNVFSIHSSQEIKERTETVVNVTQERQREVKRFGSLRFLLPWLLQAHSGGLEGSDVWEVPVMAMVEAMRAGG